ncbi:VOC family protein [Cryobacterium roopkundense]|uniref:VOC domain-containing protein n=1 Tax=Cryobacterium roopkundense TaxID=1001240 RepID=A0A7W8ZXG2_9MICO|nr:VOC family protein [Cryobacterium roopkundense]MBB5642011.1 hypothetical protein [Cryobacterium roopkundense]
MATSKIFINLPVADLEASKAFFTALGYTINPLFTDENAASVVMSDSIYAMLLVKPFFATFTDKSLIDPKSEVQVLNCLVLDSRNEVDEWAEKALAAGGAEPRTTQDYGFMYTRDIEDLDGHIWEVTWMDPEVAKNGPPAMSSGRPTGRT